MKTGLIMEGGAMRGLFTAGITDIMLENNITFDGAIGVSAGAAFGCNFKSKQIGRAVRYNVRFCKDKRYCSMRSLILTGNMFGKEFCYHEIPEKLDVFDNAAFNANPMPFYVVCTNAETGEAIYKRFDTTDGNFLEWVRASASLPWVSEIVEVDGYKLQDGGMSDSIPLKYFESIGFDKNVVILTQPKGYIKSKTSLNALMKLSLRKYPALLKAIENRHKMYNDTIKYIEQQEKDGKILVLRPEDTLPIRRTTHNPEKIMAVYNEGRKVGLDNLERIKNFLTTDL